MSNRLGAGALIAVLIQVGGIAEAETSTSHRALRRPCSEEMVHIRDFCIDRWEISTVDANSGQSLSPYYPPQRPLMLRVLDVWQIERASWGNEAAQEFLLPELTDFQRDGDFLARAVALPNQVPQGYLSRESARRACELSNKRLCSLSEWQTACRGERGTQFPYGSEYVARRCNVWRTLHPARVLHGNSSIGHLDPRLNLLIEYQVGPLLRPTGSTPTCASRFGEDAVYDMVGNLDEWVDEESGVFVGGFYARSTNKGCDAKVSNHAPAYFDYSTGARCCRSAAAR